MSSKAERTYYRTSLQYGRSPLDNDGNIVGLENVNGNNHNMHFKAASLNSLQKQRSFNSTSRGKTMSPASSTPSLCLIIVRTFFLILLYYTTSIGLTFYQKWLLKKLQFPLSIVLCHLIVKYTLASISRLVLEEWTKKTRPVVNWRNYAVKLAPAGIASALDIALSNWSFEFITVSLYTMTKSTAIIFITGFAVLFKLEKKHWSLLAIVGMISGGLVMFTYEATQFNLIGFLMVLGASFLSGLRWTLSQMLMQRSEMGLSNPLDMMYHMQPWMILALLPFAIAFEGLNLSTTENFFRYSNLVSMMGRLGEVLCGAVLAFFMELTEYLLVSHTSSLTLAISGIMKEIVTLTLAIVVTHDELNLINAIGLFVCLGGIVFHVAMKASRMRSQSREKPGALITNVGEEELLMSGIHSDSDDNENVIYETRLH